MSQSKFEQQLRRKLFDELEQTRAKALTSAYEQARTRLEQDVYSWIPAAEPSLSDHSARHIADVTENTYLLLADGDGVDCVSGVELYCLAMMVLFHDVGNLFGRQNHQDKIAEVFNWVRGNDPSVRPEKTLVLTGARAHTGAASDGSGDTLKELGTAEHLERKEVRLRDLAAVLRLADELAEGPHRTSEFMRQRGMHAPDSQIFHHYASITHTYIDRGNQRIALKYEIDIETTGSDESRRERLTSLLGFVYNRIQKLDQERRYARYYSEVLRPFGSTEVTFNFHCDGRLLALDLSPLTLTDKVIPGDPAKEIADLDPAYSIDRLVESLISACQGEGDEARE